MQAFFAIAGLSVWNFMNILRVVYVHKRWKLFSFWQLIARLQISWRVSLHRVINLGSLNRMNATWNLIWSGHWSKGIFRRSNEQSKHNLSSPEFIILGKFRLPFFYFHYDWSLKKGIVEKGVGWDCKMTSILARVFMSSEFHALNLIRIYRAERVNLDLNSRKVFKGKKKSTWPNKVSGKKTLFAGRLESVTTILGRLIW